MRTTGSHVAQSCSHLCSSLIWALVDRCPPQRGSMERYIDQPPPPGSSSRIAAKFNQRLQILLDKSAPFVATRWLVWLALTALFALRVWYLKGFYIVSYALGIFNLNLLLGFLSPQVRSTPTRCRQKHADAAKRWQGWALKSNKLQKKCSEVPFSLL